MLPRRAFAFALIGAVALANVSARAAGPLPVQQGFAVDRFHPSAAGSEWYALDSLDFRGDARGAIGAVMDYANKPLVLANGDGSERAAIVAHQLYAHVGVSLLILERVRLSASMPFALYNDGDSGTLGGYRYLGPSKPAVGDAQFGLDFRLFGRHGEIATGAIGVEAFAPTGSRDLYTGDGSARVVPRLLFAGDAGPVTWAARAGIVVRAGDPPIAGETRGTAFNFGAALGARVADKKLVVGPEIYGTKSLTSSNAAEFPLEMVIGAHYTVGDDWRVGLAAGPGLSSGLGTPIVRTLASLEFAPGFDEPKAPKKRKHARDEDKDGIPDTVDACFDKPGPATDDPATNGCPPPSDTDKDGVSDNLDACPDEAGTASADPEVNGCPADSDSDGVPDKEDACPLKPGVEQADKTQNGCPPDSDRDGILDVDDACPDKPGAKSSNPAENGCPVDVDRDHDGIKNDEDACPSDPGPADANPARNGCPKAFVKAGEIRVATPIKFAGNGARLALGKENEDTLAAVAAVLVAHPEITKVEVQGHTDNTRSEAANLALSGQRAEAVKKWLASHGVAKSRLTSVGYGQDRPIDSNATESGRANNRRVELHVVEEKSQ